MTRNDFRARERVEGDFRAREKVEGEEEKIGSM